MPGQIYAHQTPSASDLSPIWVFLVENSYTILTGENSFREICAKYEN